MSLNKKRILIFGVSGNSGRYVAKHFLNQGFEVFGVGQRKEVNDLEGLNYLSFDIRNPENFSNLPDTIDLVINFAGVQPSVLRSSENTNLIKTLREYVDTNLRGVYNILEYVLKSNIGTYVYSTTHRDYELYWKHNKLLENDLMPNINYNGDHAMYAISKVAGQMMGDYMVPLKGTRCFNLRLPMIFMIPEEPYFLSNGEKKIMPFLKVIHDAIKGKNLEIWGNPNMPRDYVYIDNLVNMVQLCFESNIKGGTFSVGTGEGPTTEKFIKSIGEIFGSSSITYSYHPQKFTYKSAVYNVKDQINLLGYKPIFLQEMLLLMKKKIYEGNYLEKWGWLN